MVCLNEIHMNTRMENLDALRSGRLNGAVRLDLSCGLTEFPSEIFDLADTLEVLDLSGNALTSLPHDLPRLRKLRVLFCSDNPFTVLPEVLGDCPSLTMVGFKANRIAHVPAASIPAGLRWLVLTDNQIAALPDALGRCTSLQKLMLAGNRLSRLPDALAACAQLELIRVAANALSAVPDVLLDLPRLAWLACGGNPWSAAHEQSVWTQAQLTAVNAEQLTWAECLGQGASGVIHAVSDAHGAPLAAKLFKGEMTSDGWPQTEMAASLQVGAHPGLVGAVARITGAAGGLDALLMHRLSAQWRNLAGPPSLDSCTRDVYEDKLAWSADVVWRMALGLTQALAHVHAAGLLHGDVYAHNVLHDGQGGVRLGDFGAATFLPTGSAAQARRMQQIEVRALGYLLQELMERCIDGPEALGVLPAMRDACLNECIADRPLVQDVLAGIDQPF
jgi:Protein kinase domain/Leucine rich repeat/Leucine Rich repeats (2 copies)